jgi:cytochrome c oxidase subunit 4
MSSQPTDVHAEEHVEHETMTKSRIWKVFFILLLITCVEFVIALVISPRLVGKPLHSAINPVYIVLTLFKAYFIVAFFMHLKFEKVGLAMIIIVPILFIIGLILVLTNESHYWITLR